jgi:hypothetical protein
MAFHASASPLELPVLSQPRQEISSLKSSLVSIDAPHLVLQRELARRQAKTAQAPRATSLPATSHPATDAGVYAIRNRITGRAYVSGDLDVELVLGYDRAALNTKQHRNSALQADWDWYGEKNFSFEVVAKIRAQADRNHGKLLQLVELWRDQLHSYGATGYNARASVPV